MPRISSDLLNCVIYLYQTRAGAEDGREPGGSGFLHPLAYPDECEVNGIHVYAVTNSHVVFGNPSAPVVRLRNRHGEPVVVGLDQNSWVRHPNGDDVAVALLKVDDLSAYRFITPRWSVKPEPPYQDKRGDYLGREVVMLGRFLELDGGETNTPVLRFGNVASPIVERLEHCKFGIKQDSFLVEMRSLSGFSGSPVFILPDFWNQMEIHPLWRKFVQWFGAKAMPKPGQPFPGYPLPVRDPRDLELLGINWCHLEHSGGPAGMAGVVPWWKLWELLDEPDLKRARKEVEDRAVQDAAKGRWVPDSDEVSG